eukprot:scaffold24124_cov36-Prasinocladus_malaysianus.AAC.1
MECKGAEALQRLIIPPSPMTQQHDTSCTTNANVTNDEAAASAGSKDASQTRDSDSKAIASVKIHNGMSVVISVGCPGMPKTDLCPGQTASLSLRPGREVRVEAEGGEYLCTCVSGKEGSSYSYSVQYDLNSLAVQHDAVLPRNVH